MQDPWCTLPPRWGAAKREEAGNVDDPNAERGRTRFTDLDGKRKAARPHPVLAPIAWIASLALGLAFWLYALNLLIG
jgi:hypothetical protein